MNTPMSVWLDCIGGHKSTVRLPTARITDEDETSFRSEYRKRSRQRSLHRIDDKADTGAMGVLSDTVHDVNFCTIHDMIGTKFKQPASSLRSACHCDDRCACLLGKLNSRETHAACCCLNKDGFSVTKHASCEKAMMRGSKRNR
ncbi:hypothetical protein [Serratia inhibens]|uniref:hypothetical protein n=1 Tax=Serratia inhibens TaxID=2338073 RepID=UPI003C7DF48A